MATLKYQAWLVHEIIRLCTHTRAEMNGAVAVNTIWSHCIHVYSVCTHTLRVCYSTWFVKSSAFGIGCCFSVSSLMSTSVVYYKHVKIIVINHLHFIIFEWYLYSHHGPRYAQVKSASTELASYDF